MPVHFDQKVQRLLPAGDLSGKEYPNLLGKDDVIDTVAAPDLAGRIQSSRRTGTVSARRALRRRRSFQSSRSFSKPPRHPKWREVNLAAIAPDWTRFKPAQDWLDKAAAGAPPSAQNSTDARPAAVSADELARFKRFLQEHQRREETVARRHCPDLPGVSDVERQAMTTPPKVTRLDPVPRESPNVLPPSPQNDVDQWPGRINSGEAEDDLDFRDALAPRAARTTILVIGGLLVALATLTLTALVVNSIVDYKLTNAEPPNVTEQNAQATATAQKPETKPLNQRRHCSGAKEARRRAPN